MRCTLATPSSTIPPPGLSCLWHSGSWLAGRDLPGRSFLVPPRESPPSKVGCDRSSNGLAVLVESVNLDAQSFDHPSTPDAVSPVRVWRHFIDVVLRAVRAEAPNPTIGSDIVGFQFQCPPSGVRNQTSQGAFLAVSSNEWQPFVSGRVGHTQHHLFIVD